MPEPIIADKNYYRDAEHNIVEEGSEQAAFLVAAKGTEIPAEVAERYAITVQPAAAEAPAEEKAEPAPKANKSASPAKNKGAK